MKLNYFLSSRATQEKTRVVMLYLRGIPKGNPKTFVRSTGVIVQEKSWDAKKQQVRPGFQGAFEANKKLNALKERIEQYNQEATRNGRGNDYDFICDATDRIIKGEVTEQFTLSFFDAYDEFLAVQKSKWSLNTYKKYKTVLSYLQGFSKAKRFPISFDVIDKRFRDKFEAYLLTDVGILDSTIGKTLRFLKTFMQWALERKYNTNTEFKLFKVKSVKTDILTLTWQELTMLLRYDFSDSPYLERVRDVFCFQCFTGQRYSDISRFRFDDVHDNVWHIRTVKTKDVLRIPLSEYALEITNRYKEQGKLPAISSQKFNEYIKIACKQAGLSDVVTTVQYRGGKRLETSKPKYDCIASHTARRTFITLSLERGMRPETLMKITGHTSLKMLQQYINVTEKITTFELERAWNKSNLSLVVNQ